MDNPGQQKSVSVVQRVIGAVMVLFSAPCVVAAIHDIVTVAKNFNGALMMGVFFSIIMMMGIGLFAAGVKKKKKAEQSHGLNERAERAVLQKIYTLGGEVTVPQLAAHSHLSTKGAQKFLQALEKDGLASSYVSSEGAIIYNVHHSDGSIDADDEVFLGLDDVEQQSQSQEAAATVGHPHHEG